MSPFLRSTAAHEMRCFVCSTPDSKQKGVRTILFDQRWENVAVLEAPWFCTAGISNPQNTHKTTPKIRRKIQMFDIRQKCPVWNLERPNIKITTCYNLLYALKTPCDSQMMNLREAVCKTLFLAPFL